MDDKTLTILEYPKILERVAAYCAFAASVEKARLLRPTIDPVLARLDPLLLQPVNLSRQEFEDLVHFVRDSLLDDGAEPDELCPLIPAGVPSGLPMLRFQGCDRGRH